MNEREFLAMRACLLDLAAAIDRAPRSQDSVWNDPSMQLVRRALDRLREGEPLAAADVQLIFSLPYNESWREEFGLETPKSSKPIVAP